MTSAPLRTGVTRAYRLSFNQALHIVGYTLQGPRERMAVPTLRMSLFLDGDVNVAALRRSVVELIRRHEILRTAFPHPCRWSDELQDAVLRAVLSGDICGGGALRQRAWHPAFCDLMAVRAITMVSGEWTSALSDEVSRPCNIAVPPLMRMIIRKRRSGGYHLVVVLHHLIGDGLSLGVMRRELEALYAQHVGARAEALMSPLSLQYGDFAESQWARYGSESRMDVAMSMKRATTYAFDWRSFGRRGSRLVGAGTGRSDLALPPPLLHEVTRVLMPKKRATLYMVFVAAVAVAISGHTSTDKIGFLTFCTNRTSSAIACLIGWLANLGVLCVDVDRTGTLAAVLTTVKSRVIDVLRRQDVPLQELYPMGNFIRCDVVTHGGSSSVCGMRVTATPVRWRTRGHDAPFCLELHHWRPEGGTERLVIQCHYSRDRHDAATVGQLLRSIRTVLQCMSEDPDQRVYDVVDRMILT